METAAQTHALLRAKSGFDINQLVSEYRALRASILALWLEKSASAVPDINNIIRFNEATDQAVAESVAVFSADAARVIQEERAGALAKQNTLDAIMEHIPEGITIAEGPDVLITRVSQFGQVLTGLCSANIGSEMN